MGSPDSSSCNAVGSKQPSTPVDSSELDGGEVSGAQPPVDAEGTDGLDEEQVHLEAGSSKEPVRTASVKKGGGFAEIAEIFLEARRRRGTFKPASFWVLRLPGQRIIQLLLLMVIVVHCISLVSLLKGTIADVAQSQKQSAGASLQDKTVAELEEAGTQHSPEELSLALPIDDQHMDKYERRLGRAARLLQKAWLEADSQTQQIFARLFTPGRDVAGALNPFLQLEKTARSFGRPPFADPEDVEEDVEEQLRSGQDEEGASGDGNSNAHEGVAEIEGAEKVQDGLEQMTESSEEDKARADAIGQATLPKRGLEVNKGATVRDKFEAYVRLVIAVNRLRSPGRGAHDFLEKSEEESESAEAEEDDEESGDEYDLMDTGALDLVEASKEYTKQAGAHEASVADEETGVTRKSKRTEGIQTTEESEETNEHAAKRGSEAYSAETFSGEALSNTEHEFGRGVKALGEEQQAREAESKGETTDMRPGTRAVRVAERVEERLVSEVNESRKVYAARLKLVTALMKAARRRIQAIGVSLSFASQHRVSSPLYGLRGYPMPFLEMLKRKPRHPAGYSRLYEQLQDRIFPAPESDAPDTANVPLELIDRLANAVRLSDLLIEQDQGVAASFNQFFRVVRTSKEYDDEEAGDLEHLAASSRLSMDPGGHIEFPVALFRAVVGNLKALHDLSFITDETIRDWSEKWTIDNIWAQTYKLCDAERERTAALHRIKQSLRKSWSAAQGKAVADDDVFLLAIYLL
ncbi:hypothetical protein Emag_004654 [Eimeria magna]